MTIVQLEYIIALAKYGNFRIAAENLFITQPTLSMQVQNLEDELEVKLFDRSKQPVVPTPVGELVIEQAKKTVAEAEQIKALVKVETIEIQGQLSVGIIPTVAPYLVPLFLGDFLKKYPKVSLTITESTTGEILKNLKEGALDCGILSTPLEMPGITELPLYYETFVAYGNADCRIMQKRTLNEDDLHEEEIWLLKDGHCFRNQVFRLCKHTPGENHHTVYEAGSIETLKRIVDKQGGMTIMPELALEHLSENDFEQVRYFNDPEPRREIAIVTYRHQVKDRLVKALKEAVVQCIPEKYRKEKNSNVLKPS